LKNFGGELLPLWAFGEDGRGLEVGWLVGVIVGVCGLWLHLTRCCGVVKVAERVMDTCGHG
jgi:hypothetical protein